MTEQTLNIKEIPNTQYINDLFTNYIKKNFTGQSLNYFYGKYLEEGYSLYETLLYNKAIAIKAANREEAAVLNLALGYLIDVNYHIIEIMIDGYIENKEEKENARELTVEEVEFMVNRLNKDTKKEFIDYITDDFDLNKAKNIKDYLIQLTVDQLWNAKDWLDGQLDEEDNEAIIEAFPQEEEEEEEEEEIRKPLPDILTTLTIEEPIKINDFFEYVIRSTTSFVKSSTLEKPKYKQIEYIPRFDRNNYLVINTPKCVAFDRDDVLNLLSRKLSSQCYVRIKEIIPDWKKNHYQKVFEKQQSPVKQVQKFTLENIYEYSSSEMNQYIATHTEEIYDNINDQRYMILYYLYQDDLLDEKDNELLVNNGTRFRQVLDVSNSAEELRENLL